MDHYEEHKPDCMAQYLAENLNGKLVISLRDISHTMRALYEGRGSQKRVLIVLSETGTITQRELTRRLGIQPGSASEVIAKLENARLVARTSSEADRRTADISLTKEGMRQAEAALEQRKQRHEEMFSSLTREEKEHLLSLLEKINADWQERYGDRRKHFGEQNHSRRCVKDFAHHADYAGHGCHRQDEIEGWPDSGHEERRGCTHDCAVCPHPCGRKRNRRA